VSECRKKRSSNPASVILGASDFKKWPDLNRKSFASSASDFASYLSNENLLALPQECVLNLFGSALPPGDQLEAICDFLARCPQSVDNPLDLILYYVGHGGFTGYGKESYYLAIAGTKDGIEGSTSIRMSDLSSSLNIHAAHARKYLILDCCFAASAFSEFQGSGLADLISRQVREPLPAKGTALLCSSGSREISMAPADERHTMFSGALLEVLRNGEPCGEQAFSLSGVGRRVKDLLRRKYPKDWTRPEVHSPEMREGDIADVPLFPNPQFVLSQDAASSADYARELEDQLRSRTAQLRQLTSELERSYDITLEMLGTAIDLKQAEKKGHSKRVTAFTIAITRAMGVPKSNMDVIARAAFLHDVGKMGIPETILNKAGPLTKEEEEKMREHCFNGYKILKRIPFLSEAAEIVYAHQEHYDGKGYPRRLIGEEIPLGARIFSVADALEVITTGTSYQPRRSLAEAREEIRLLSGQQFDPKVVDVFLSLPDRLWTDLREQVDSRLERE